MGSVYFKANREELQKIAANAINASEPVGMGLIHFKPGDFRPDQIEINPGVNPVYIDYYQGRMVKLMIRHDEERNCWRTENDIRADYQGWKRKYPTAESLLKASGITEMEFEEPEKDDVPE